MGSFGPVTAHRVERALAEMELGKRKAERSVRDTDAMTKAAQLGCPLWAVH